MAAQGAQYAAEAQAAGLKSEAEWKAREAAVNQMETAVEIANRKRQETLALGAQTAQYAGAGVDVSGGTPLQVGMATIQESGMDIQKARIQGKEFQDKAIAEATNLRAQAKATIVAGKYNAMSSIISGIGGAVSAIPGTAFSSSAFAAPQTASLAQPIATVAPYNLSGGGVVNRPFAYKNPSVFGGPR